MADEKVKAPKAVENLNDEQLDGVAGGLIKNSPVMSPYDPMRPVHPEIHVKPQQPQVLPERHQFPEDPQITKQPEQPQIRPVIDPKIIEF